MSGHLCVTYACAGYHRGSDSVLILDVARYVIDSDGMLGTPCHVCHLLVILTPVGTCGSHPPSRFKYPPYWVPVSKLWESMSVVDRATGSPRGFFIVKSSHGEHV